MILGIDAGGTNYDGVALREGDGVTATAKRPSDEADAFDALVDDLLDSVDTVDRLVVSTTRVLNSAVQDALPDCTNVVVPGVGLSPELAYAGDENIVAEGCVDHRGRVTEPLDVSGVEPSHETVSVTAKFSTRNPEPERETADALDAPVVALGHESGGALGFPARAETTVANAKSMRVFGDFESSLHDALEKRGVEAPVYYLKGDSAMLSRESAKTTPAHTLRSGPASSSLGLVALSGVEEAVCVDVGGTTTDVTLVEDGFPALAENVGAGCLSTFYEGVVSVDATVGGDTRVDEDGLTGVREGPPAAFGGPSPTPTDALRVLGETEEGDEKRARDALSTLGEPEEVARETVEAFVTAVAEAVESLESRSGTVVLGGALAPALADRLADRLGWAAEVVVPENAEVCGAVGCAVAHVSVKTHVHVDTARGEMTVASAGEEKVEEVETGKEYGEDEARELVRRETAEATHRAGGEAEADDIQITSFRRFNVVEDGRVVGSIVDAEAQAQPGGAEL